MTSLASLPIGSLKWTCRLKEATDNAAYRSKFRHVPSPESGVSRSLVVRGFRDRNQFVNATASRRTDPDFVGFGRVP